MIQPTSIRLALGPRDADSLPERVTAAACFRVASCARADGAPGVAAFLDLIAAAVGRWERETHAHQCRYCFTMVGPCPYGPFDLCEDHTPTVCDECTRVALLEPLPLGYRDLPYAPGTYRVYVFTVDGAEVQVRRPRSQSPHIVQCSCLAARAIHQPGGAPGRQRCPHQSRVERWLEARNAPRYQPRPVPVAAASA